MEEKTLFIKESKGKDRLLPVTDKAILAIKEYLVIRSKIKVQSTALFINKQGGRLNINDTQGMFYKLKKRLGLNRSITIHQIRASISSHLLRRGMDIVLISSFLGHTRISTTQVYTRVMNADLKVMIDTLHPRNSMGE